MTSTMSLVEFMQHPLFLGALPVLLLLYLRSLRNKSRKHRGIPPGPLPKLPIIGHLHLVGPSLHQSLHHFSLRYGPIFSLRFGSVPCVVASTPHLAKQLLHANELSFTRRFQSSAIERLTYNSSFAFGPYGPYWKFAKKLSMNELLGTRSVNSFQAIRTQEYHRLLRFLGQKAETGEVVNLSEELQKLTNNIISRMMLGQVVGAWAVVREVSKIFRELNMYDFFWLFRMFDFQGIGKRVEGIFERFDKIVERVITEREKQRKKGKNGSKNGDGQGNKDFLDILLDYSENETSEVKVTRDHIKGIFTDLFAAGTNNTAIATEWSLVELINNPKILQKAREEIQNVAGNSRLAEESDCPSLPYIQAIVKEALRLHPPLPLVSRRCVQECKIENYVIPENTLVLVNVWAIGRDPKNWENALEFRPERFIESPETAQVDVRGQHFQLLPFGAGRRKCPGMTLAMQEIPALIADIIQCFDFQLIGPQGEKLSTKLDMDERSGLTASIADDILCVPIARCNVLEILG
uniref:Cytochrome P450 CYP93B65 n=1 Tax=Polygala tenuifolia TaxID=355332 RepID=A0A1Z2WUZ2_9FABA|nr:cytochrome P450 CYP93B65 [Polygala tenuifolia]